MSLHAKLSASKTKEWMHCPGQIVVDEMFPQEDVPNQAARLGTAAHALIETCLQKGDMPEHYHLRLIRIINEGEPNEGFSILRKGAKWPKDPQLEQLTFEVDDDMVEATTHMVMYVANRCEELGLIKKTSSDKRRVAAVAGLVASGTVRLETRTNLFPHRDDTGGTADVTIDAWPDVLEIVDYKNGSGIFVSVMNNPQIRTYGMGVAQSNVNEYITRRDQIDYDLIRMTIVQPRHHEAPDGGVMYEELAPGELLEWRDKELLPAVARVDEAREFIRSIEYGDQLSRNEVLNALAREGYMCFNNEDHKCWFCESNTQYEAAHEKVQEIARMDFSDEPLDLEIDSDIDALSKRIAWIPFLETWIKGAKAAAKAAAMAGLEVDNHKLIRKTKHLTFRDEEGDKDAMTLALTKDFGIDKSKFVTDKFATATQIMEMVNKSDATEEEKKRFAEDFTHRPQGDIDLVHKSKKGTPYVPDTAKADFEDIELDEVGENTPQEDDPWA